MKISEQRQVQNVLSGVSPSKTVKPSTGTSNGGTIRRKPREKTMSTMSSEQNDPQQKSITISPAIESVDDKVWAQIVAECLENGPASSEEEIVAKCLENGAAPSEEELELAVHISANNGVNEAILKLFCEGKLRLKQIDGKIDVEGAA